MNSHIKTLYVSCWTAYIYYKMIHGPYNIPSKYLYAYFAINSFWEDVLSPSREVRGKSYIISSSKSISIRNENYDGILIAALSKTKNKKQNKTKKKATS